MDAHLPHRKVASDGHVVHRWINHRIAGHSFDRPTGKKDPHNE